jgi:hypothetical protein
MSDTGLGETLRQITEDESYVELLDEVQQTKAFAELVRDISEEPTDSRGAEDGVDFERIFKIWGISFVTGTTVVAALAFGQFLAGLVVLAALAQISGVSVISLLEKEPKER